MKSLRSRYARHYKEQNNFIIEASHPESLQIVIKPNEAVELLGDLIKYAFGNCKQEDED